MYRGIRIMTKDEIFFKLKEVLIREFELDPDKIKPETQLYPELDLDSLDEVDLLANMKEYIPNAVDPDLFSDARTVQDLADILFSLVQPR